MRRFSLPETSNGNASSFRRFSLPTISNSSTFQTTRRFSLPYITASDNNIFYRLHKEESEANFVNKKVPLLEQLIKKIKKRIYFSNFVTNYYNEKKKLYMNCKKENQNKKYIPNKTIKKEIFDKNIGIAAFNYFTKKYCNY